MSRKYRLLNRYLLEQADDRVAWMRVFDDELRLMTGHGVYRDDVLVLLAPTQIDAITDLDGVRAAMDLDALPEWDKTRFLIHMGTVNQGYPVQEAIRTSDGSPLAREEVLELVARIESVFT